MIQVDEKTESPPAEKFLREGFLLGSQGISLRPHRRNQIHRYIQE